MRSGATWAATDYYQNQSQCFEFTATRVSNTRQVQIDWWMTTYCNDSAASPTYYLCWKNQKLVVNGTTQINWVSSGNPMVSGTSTYYGFADKDSWLDKNYRNRTYHDYNGDYLGIERYLYVLGTKWQTGSFKLTANDAGDVSFSVSGNFGWYGKTGLNFSKTFTVSGKVPKATYPITYNYNNNSFVSGNTVSNLPSSGTKTYNVNYTLSSQKPISNTAAGEQNYEFVNWAETVTDSFNGKTIHTPEEVYKTNKALALYALWKPITKSIIYDFNGGTDSQGNIESRISVPYDSIVTSPSDTTVTKYGCTLLNWKSQTFNRQITPATAHKCIGNETFNATWKPNNYTISLVDINDKIIRQINTTFDSTLYGDFSYKILGYKLLGWSLAKYPIRNPGDDPLPIIDNSDFASTKKVGIYVGAGDFTDTPFMISENEARKYTIGKDVTLYPVLEYSTSMYVYTNSGWKLAMPYVYTNSGWKQTLGNIYTNKWTK